MSVDSEENVDELPQPSRVGEPEMDAEEARVFARALTALNEADVPYVVAGAFAIHAYTGIWRDTKDLDIYLLPEDLQAALATLEQAGFRTTVEYAHWLAKAHHSPYFVDILFGSGHGQLQVEKSWLERGRPVEIAGVNTHLIAPEALLASKAFVGERYRFDGADITHLILKTKGQLDWGRVRGLLHEHWDLLLWHLVLFSIVYPGHTDYLPDSLLPELFEDARHHWRSMGDGNTFRGSLLDPFTFAADIEDWGYEDQRNTEPLVDEEGKVL